MSADLGVWFNANFSTADHIRNICETCFIKLRDLRQVRRYLTDDAAILVANALVSSRLDYCTLATALLLMLPRFGMICLMRSVLPQLSPVSGKG